MVQEPPKVLLTGQYSRKEASEALGICVRTLQNYINSGYIKFKLRKCNGRKFIEGKEIIRFWNESIA